MIHIKAFIIGVFIVCLGIYFGDPIPQEFGADLDNAIRLTENRHCLDNVNGRDGYCIGDVSIGIEKLIQ